MDLSIVLPVFNERLNIEILLKRISSLNKEGLNLEFIFVDGSSTDGSQNLILDASANDTRIKLLESKEKLGYGFDLLRGLNESKGEFVAWTHADLQTDLEDVFRCFLKIKDKNDTKYLVKGLRKKRRLSEKIFSKLMEYYVFLKMGEKFTEINAQPKLFHRKFIHHLTKPQSPNDFSFDLFALIQAKKAGYKIIEIPVYFNDRIYGQAKGGGSLKTKLQLIRRTIKYINHLDGLI